MILNNLSLPLTRIEVNINKLCKSAKTIYVNPLQLVNSVTHCFIIIVIKALL